MFSSAVVFPSLFCVSHSEMKGIISQGAKKTDPLLQMVANLQSVIGLCLF